MVNHGKSIYSTFIQYNYNIDIFANISPTCPGQKSLNFHVSLGERRTSNSLRLTVGTAPQRGDFGRQLSCLCGADVGGHRGGLGVGEAQGGEGPRTVEPGGGRWGKPVFGCFLIVAVDFFLFTSCKFYTFFFEGKMF